MTTKLGILVSVLFLAVACDGGSSSTTTTTTGGPAPSECSDLCTYFADDCKIPNDQCMQQCANLNSTQRDCMWKAGCDENAQKACLIGGGTTGGGTSGSSGGTTGTGDICSTDPRGATHYSCRCSDGSNISGCVLSSTDPCQNLCGSACGASTVCTAG
jgi:hypothetical protein